VLNNLLPSPRVLQFVTEAAVKMHDNFEKEHVGHRERLSDTLSLDLALLSKIIVHFDSSFSDNCSTRGEAMRWLP